MKKSKLDYPKGFEGGYDSFKEFIEDFREFYFYYDGKEYCVDYDRNGMYLLNRYVWDVVEKWDSPQDFLKNGKPLGLTVEEFVKEIRVTNYH